MSDLSEAPASPASRISVLIQREGRVTLLELADVVGQPSGFVNEFTATDGAPMIAVSGHAMIPAPQEMGPIVSTRVFDGDDALANALAHIQPPVTETTEQRD